MSSISSATWRKPDWRITGRRVKLLQRRALTEWPVGPTFSSREFRTQNSRGKYYGFVIAERMFYGYVQHNHQVGTKGMQLRVRLPAKMTLAMYLSLKQRRLI